MSPQAFSGNTAQAPLEKLSPNPKLKLKDQFHEVARFKHISIRTETSYWEWVVRFLKFHKERAGAWRHPRELGSKGVTPFLTWLANVRRLKFSNSFLNR